MITAKSKIETYHLLEPSRFSILKKLELVQTKTGSDDRYELGLPLELAPSPVPAGRKKY